MNKFSKKKIENKVSLMSSRFYAGRHTHMYIHCYILTMTIKMVI